MKALYAIRSGQVQGRAHAKMLFNCQDALFERRIELRDESGGRADGIVAVVLDGCGSGHFSEVGALMHGQRLINEMSRLLKKYQASFLTFDPNVYEQFREHLAEFMVRRTVSFVEDAIRCAGFDMVTDPWAEVKGFIGHNLLATLMFVVGIDDHFFVGSAGDGCFYVEWDDGIVESGEIEQDNTPHYLVYNWFPPSKRGDDMKELITPPDIRWYRDPKRIMISTDGASRFIHENRVPDLFALKGKFGLQRKLNAGHRFAAPNGRHRPEWETDDDAAILLIERVEDVDED